MAKKHKAIVHEDDIAEVSLHADNYVPETEPGTEKYLNEALDNGMKGKTMSDTEKKPRGRAPNQPKSFTSKLASVLSLYDGLTPDERTKLTTVVMSMYPLPIKGDQ